MFLCCQIGPLGPFWFYLGEGQASCCSVPRGPPQPGNGGHPSALRRAPVPARVPGPQSVGSCLEQSPSGCSLGWWERTQSPHLLPWDRYSPPPISASRAGRGENLLPLVKGSGCVLWDQSPASLGSSAAKGCSPHQALTPHICLDHPPRPLGLGSPAPRGGRGRTPLWCHINMYMCI